jgi:hypothetical protein
MMPPTAHIQQLFQRKKKEKKEEKIDPATRGARDPPKWRGGERFGHPSGNFYLSGEKRKEKKKKRKEKKDPATRHGRDPPQATWGWQRSTPTARGREIWPPLMAIFVFIAISVSLSQPPLTATSLCCDPRLGLAMTQPWVAIFDDFSTKPSLKNRF